MVKNSFSQITDKQFYSGNPWYNYYITEDQFGGYQALNSNTTALHYNGTLHSSSTSLDNKGKYTYTYTTSVNDDITATVWPRITVTSSVERQSTANYIQSTTSSISLPVANRARFTVYPVFGTMYYEVRRVADWVAGTISISTEAQIANGAKIDYNLSMSVNNYYPSQSDLGGYRSSSYNINGTHEANLFDGGVSLVGPPTYYYYTITGGLQATFTTFNNETMTTSFPCNSVTGVISYMIADGLTWTSNFGTLAKKEIDYNYLTYYSAVNKVSELTTITMTYSDSVSYTTNKIYPPELTMLDINYGITYTTENVKILLSLPYKEN